MTAMPDPGLCGRCRWAVPVPAARGARFLRCARSDGDRAYQRYPRLPVTACPGFEAPASAPVTVPPVAAPFDDAPTPTAVPGGPTLFERAGGREAVERVVERFYHHVAEDAELRAIFPADLGPGRAKQTLFLEQWLGGAAHYSERYGHPRLRRRHFPFVISDRLAGRWLRHMGDALREAGVPPDVRGEITAALGPLAHHMVNDRFDVPRAPLEQPYLT